MFSPVDSPSAPSPMFCNLPNEILLPILHNLPIADLLSFSATCRSLHRLITDPPFMNRILQEALLQGSCRYILPVHGLLDDEERAFEAIRLWLPESVRPASVNKEVARAEGEEDNEGDRDEEANSVEGEVEGQETSDEDEPELSIPPIKPLILDPKFPALAFMRACHDSDSMMNRKRLWGLVKQVEDVWGSYRLNGWEVNRFYPSEEVLGEIHKDPKECKPPCDW